MAYKRVTERLIVSTGEEHYSLVMCWLHCHLSAEIKVCCMHACVCTCVHACVFIYCTLCGRIKAMPRIIVHTVLINCITVLYESYSYAAN